ncbi:glycoside hydrolase family 97 protein [Catenovulum sp. 2E275]|uniref:glycoside hydrolase family 97 protein n=1 Tax=Catenovulum sp. 2E275 TaxID=2980497 RepID=UPI0021D0159A|nr:glycoside hydrolase family 97 protein [Catenovulum sp. 2E275]MCU4675720.1 glycoside hydrolase family 97 protein [Catenovulum sp. 2E275]
MIFSKQSWSRLTASKHKLIFFSILGLNVLPNFAAQAQTYTLSSPDSNIEVELNFNQGLTYQVEVDDKLVISPSQLDLVVDKHPNLSANVKVVNTATESVDEWLAPEVKVKSAKIKNHYNQLELIFDNQYHVQFRAFNNGVAYRFKTNINQDIQVNQEIAEFNFAKNALVYYPQEEGFYSHNERSYLKKQLTDISTQDLASTPALVDSQGIKVLITETALEDYAGLWLLGNGKGLTGTFANYPLAKQALKPLVDRNEPITKRAAYIAKTQGKRDFPWRVLAIAENDGQLVTNQLTYQLAKPNQIGDTSWIKPGKVAWDWYNANNLFGVDFKAGVNTQTYKYYIDFASDYGLEYVILDEGWYPLGDLMGTVPDMDVPEIIAYAKSKNVDIILWTSWLTLRDQFEQAMDRFAELGAVGIKPDFFQRDDQQMVNFYWKIAKEAAKRHLLVDYHGSYKPAGLRRTYPNVISREGVKGLEWNKWSEDSTPEHNTTLPFIRMVAGPMDYTPGAMSNAVGPKAFEDIEYGGKAEDHQDFAIRFNRPMSQTTRVHQMAMLTVYESPLQMMADTPSRYRQENESASFMAKVPTVWDDTQVLHGKIGDYISVARLHANTWFIGTLNDENARELSLDLSFLTDGQTYQMTIFEDGINADRFAEDYKKRVIKVNKQSKLTMKLAPGGGYTARIEAL